MKDNTAVLLSHFCGIGTAFEFVTLSATIVSGILTETIQDSEFVNQLPLAGFPEKK
jgi:hypothetical protein